MKEIYTISLQKDTYPQLSEKFEEHGVLVNSSDDVRVLKSSLQEAYNDLKSTLESAIASKEAQAKKEEAELIQQIENF